MSKLGQRPQLTDQVSREAQQPVDVNLGENVLGFLLRRALPLLIDPVGSHPTGSLRLRGIVRSSANRARIILSRDTEMRSGVGYEFDLVRDGTDVPVDSLIDWLRIDAPVPSVVTPSSRDRAEFDIHLNQIVDAADAGFSFEDAPRFTDNNLFGMLSIFIHGGGFPWFEETYSCVGFMRLGTDACRIYIQTPSNQGKKTYGIDVPLRSADGSLHSGMGGSFPQDLASVVDSGTLFVQPESSPADDYCEKVYDMAKWVDPPSP